ncbi:Nudix family hydrolase [Beggiatoa alba]|nr:Nudix family hydrolase [Beggiatoa alba]
MKPKIHVAVGVIRNKEKKFLISKRHAHLHQGGLWEFPGGKVESNEAVYDALCRELNEELNIEVRQAKPLLQITHQYNDKHVLLDVWMVDAFDGVIESLQQQPFKWIAAAEFSNYSFPAANKAILNSLCLPPYYAITGKFQDKQDYLRNLQYCLSSGIKLIQLRHKSNDIHTLVELAEVSMSLCERENAKLMVNDDIDFMEKCDVDGLHLNSQRVFQYSSRPISHNKLLAASVHNIKELQQAISIDVDFVVVSPVLETPSHPGSTLLNWNGLTELVSHSSIPIFALGGMKKELLSKVKQCGSYGIAAISEFWNRQ